MKKKSKLRTIISAFSSEIPIDAEWFQERMTACEGCEYNSDNVLEEDLTLFDKVKIKNACSEGSMCKACGCCLHEKLGQKTEQCGLSALGKEPRWNALSVETSSGDDLDVEILDKTALTINLDIGTKMFLVKLGDVPEKIKEIKLQIHRKNTLKISQVKVQCSCTVPEQVQVDDNTVNLGTKIDTSRFTKDARFEKKITIVYYEGKGTKSTIIKFIGYKK